MKKLLGVVLVVLVAVGSCALPCWLAPDNAAVSVSAAPLPDALAPVATAAAVQSQAVRARQAGRVWEVYVGPGQRVRKGDVLAKLAQPLHTLEQQRLQGLVAQQQKTYAALRTQQPAPAALAAARQQLLVLRQQLAQAPQALTFVFVTAPEDGLITSRPVAPGDYLPADATVLLYQSGAAPDTTPLLTSVE